MPHVLHAGKNIAHRRTPPAVGVFKLVVPAVARALCGKVGRRAKHLFLGQNIRDLIHALAVIDHAEDAAPTAVASSSIIQRCLFSGLSDTRRWDDSRVYSLCQSILCAF